MISNLFYMLQKIVYLLVILLGILVISWMVVASEPYDTTTYSKIKNGLYSLYSKNLISSDEYELKRKAYYSDIFESNTFGPDRALANYLEYEKNISEKIIKTPINTPNIQISPNNRFYTRVKAQYEVKLWSMNEDSLNTLLIKAQNQLKKYRKWSIAETKLP